MDRTEPGGEAHQSHLNEKALVSVLLSLGTLTRMVWVSRSDGLTPIASESHNVAVSLARTGRFADPFTIHTGFTAHVGMLTPLPSALCYWLFGVDTRMAELVLSLWTVTLVIVTIWLGWKILRELGTPVLARILAVAFLALTPIQFGLEMREGRSWEVILATAILLRLLLQTIRIDRRDRVGPHELIILGATTGLLSILSPPAGLAAFVSLSLLHFKRLTSNRWWLAPVSLGLTICCLIGFWATRNMMQMREPIFLRDNLGLELSLSNYSGALHVQDERAQYVARIHEIHPLGRDQGILALQRAGGELPYYHKLTSEVSRWIAEHPIEFLRLSIQRFFEFYLPPQWFWATYTAPGKGILLRQFIVWTSALIGLITLAIKAQKSRAYSYLLIAVLACSIPYIAVQPILRYRYLVSTLLIFLAFDGASRFVKYAKSFKDANA